MKNAVYALAAVSVASVLALAGCGTSSTHQATTNNPALEVIPGLNGAFADNFNPYSPSALSGTLGLVYQPLFYFNLVGPQTYGLLGKSYAWSNGNRTLTVTLRDGVKWSNGTPLTASDVLYSFDVLRKFPSLDTSDVWSHLSSVSSKGSNQVVFQFKSPDVPFAYYVLDDVYIVPKSIWSHYANPAQVTNTNPVGTGPYVVHTFATQSYTFTPNKHYWGGVAKVPELKYLEYSGNQSATLALASGTIAWTDLFFPNIDKVFVNKDPQYNHYWFSVGGTLMLFPNLKNSLLSQLPVREAISAAINRKQLDDVGEYGYEPPATPTALLFPAQKSWEDPHLPQSDRRFTFSPSRAEQILSKAGFKRDAQGVYTSPSGQPLDFTLEVPAGWTDWDADCSLMATELKKVGIDVTVEQLSYGAYYSNLTSGHYQLAMASPSTGPTPYYLYQSYLAPSAEGNYEHWANSSTTNALNAYQATSNLAQQKRLIASIEKQVAQDLPTIPLIYGATWFEYSTKSYTGWPSAKDPYAQPAPYNFPAEGIVLMHLTPRH